MKRDLHALFDEAERRGWVIERTRSGHFKLWHPPTGAFIYSGGTPSCPRAIANAAAALRRAERQSRGSSS